MEELKDCLMELIYKNAERLIENNPEAYFIRNDGDYVGVGCGSVCVRNEPIYDEDTAFEDAKSNLIFGIEDGDEEAIYSLFDDKDFVKVFCKFLERL